MVQLWLVLLLCIMESFDELPSCSQPSDDSSNYSRLWLDTDVNWKEIAFDKPSILRPGPTTQLERMSWSDHLWDSGTGRQRDRLLLNLTRMWAMSCFTGMSSFQQLILQIVWTANKHLTQPMAVPLEEIAHEKKLSRQQFIRGLTAKYRPKHLCGDVLSRLSP